VAQLFSLGDIERFDFMKRPRIIWLILLAAAVVCYWFPISPAPATRIRIESDDSGSVAASSYSPYDTYFVRVNFCREIFIPNTKTPIEAR
jgi:hypothetical protein